jgi:hypothetical protein
MVKYESRFISINISGILTIKEGYAWDGASGPTYDTENTIVPSCVHDALYQLMREKAIPRSFRIKVDKLFYKMLRSRGMMWIRAKYWYRGVRMGGSSSTDPKNKKPILTAT